MTGGTHEAQEINRLLAKTAQNFGIAMGLGSQRAAIEDPDLAYSFKIRDVAPDILLFSNLGAVQLNYGYSIEHCRQAVDMIEADALVLHLNPLQEALQPEGETRFEGLLKKIETVCSKIDQPVIVKEVGWGISGSVAKKLMDAGISAIDVAGAGGTSWAKVEMHRADSQINAEIAAEFDDWGIPTVDSILQVKQAAPGLPIFASGGIRNGVDIAKSIALGANLAGIAGKFLKAASQGESALQKVCLRLERELKISMFASGAGTIEALQNTKIHFR
jgi:isopentenyl-diphosphate Delta-isomerase